MPPAQGDDLRPHTDCCINFFRFKSTLWSDKNPNRLSTFNLADHFSCHFHTTCKFIRKQRHIKLFCHFQCFFIRKRHGNFRDPASSGLLCRTFCDGIPTVCFFRCFLIIQTNNRTLHCYRNHLIHAKLHRFLYDQLHLVAFGKPLEKIQL